MAINKIMHFLWVGGPMPKVYEKSYESFSNQHPGWRIVVWDDERFFHEFKEELKEYEEALGAMQYFVQKTDLYRLLILNKYGGFYSDVDVVFFGNFNKYCKHDFVAFSERVTKSEYEHKSHCVRKGHAIANGFMGANINSLIVLEMLDRIKNLKEVYHPSNKVAFGPKLIEEVIYDWQYNENKFINAPAYDIHIGDSDILYPMNKDSTVDTMNFTENTLAWHWYNSCGSTASKQFEKYILGGGISSLVFAYLNPEFKIITPEVGGKLKTKFISATMLLHKSTATIKLLKELGISFDFITHDMRYITHNDFKEEISGVDRLTMIRKKMTDWNYLPELKELDIVDKNLSTEKNIIELISVNSSKLVELLEAKVKDRIITGMCSKITNDTIICNDKTYFYSELISTIPLPIFKKIYDKPIKQEPKGMSVTFVLSPDLPKILKDKHFDLVYNYSTTIPWTRINKDGDEYLYEFTGHFTEKDAKYYFDKVSSYHVERYGIVESDPIDKIENITFIGRFARWEHAFKINNAIEMAYDYKNRSLTL